jgi:amino acid transporter
MPSLLSLVGLGAGGLLMTYGALVIAAVRLRWKWFTEHPQVRRTVQANGQQRATLIYTVTGLGLLSLGLIVFIASLVQFR